MLSETEKKELLEKLRIAKDELRTLREEVNTLNSKKEETFTEKNNASKEIRELIGKVKDSKVKRDEKTAAVKEEKEKRQKLTEEIKEKITKIEESKPKTEEKPSQSPAKQDSGKPAFIIKKEIKALEYKIETEGMSFDKEQKMMKVINSLKKQLVEAEKKSKAFHEMKNISHELRPLKKDASDIHRKIQEDASESQKFHEEMIGASKKIDELKKQEKELSSRFLEEKKTYQDAVAKLKAKIEELNQIREKLDMHGQEVKEDRKEKQNKSLKEKQNEVLEKMRKGEKLTTEDLIIMQGMDE